MNIEAQRRYRKTYVNDFDQGCYSERFFRERKPKNNFFKYKNKHVSSPLSGAKQSDQKKRTTMTP